MYARNTLTPAPPGRKTRPTDPAREAMFSSHIGLARSLANRFTNRGEPLDDLVQVAMVGLLNAVDRFDPDRGIAFSTFATPTILGELRRHFRDRRWAVHAPRRAQENYLLVRTAVEVLTQQLARSPKIEEIATHTGLTEDAVIEGLEAGQAFRALSLDARAPGDDGGSAIEVPIVDRGIKDVDDADLLRSLLARLDDRERKIVELRFHGSLTQSEIARMLDMSQMQVSRILTRTLGKLRVWGETAVQAPERLPTPTA
jgi:RNA polymerase sigma-B factor